MPQAGGSRRDCEAARGRTRGLPTDGIAGSGGLQATAPGSRRGGPRRRGRRPSTSDRSDTPPAAHYGTAGTSRVLRARVVSSPHRPGISSDCARGEERALRRPRRAPNGDLRRVLRGISTQFDHFAHLSDRDRVAGRCRHRAGSDESGAVCDCERRPIRPSCRSHTRPGDSAARHRGQVAPKQRLRSAEVHIAPSTTDLDAVDRSSPARQTNHGNEAVRSGG